MITQKFQPHFTICVYEKHEDKWISGNVLSSGKWEPGISITMRDILLRHAKIDTLVLDVGANLGIHGLYAAQLGHRVWAIEPQERNLIKASFYRSFLHFLWIIHFKDRVCLISFNH